MSPPDPQHGSDPNPYTGRGVIGLGLTGLILKLDEGRVVKVAKVYQLDNIESDDARSDMEYINNINRDTLKNEKSVYERLGSHKGIVTCFKTSDYGIELAFAKQGDLESHIAANPEPDGSSKTDWIVSLISTFSYIHSRGVLVDDIALRNILVSDGRLKLADFGQSILLPLTADVDTRVHKYYFFDNSNPQWPTANELPSTHGLFFGSIIRKCWSGEYASASSVNAEAQILLTHNGHMRAYDSAATMTGT
ncbi:hypothetical protein AJ80_02301 [Polytolypa hystricis UAMH7299]|uniref:non-specific serine/threonine protein kinase n=1 Tax=Polytolypa hystricis (strain UAMH7299) TaxID=1447883 RepID=A0A2B7YQU8_POLH7|nr:hypothetical protein AJ80_02301 [Polytolypa hystricis UAMH7299]